jgi:hypothetical protein
VFYWAGGWWSGYFKVSEIGAGGGADAVDVSVVQVLQAGGEPFVLAVQQRKLQAVGEVVVTDRNLLQFLADGYALADVIKGRASNVNQQGTKILV